MTNQPVTTRQPFSRRALAFIAVPFALFVLGVIFIGGKYKYNARPPESVMDSWRKATIAEPIGFLHFPLDSKSSSWIAFETDHYLVVNARYGMANTCAALTPVNMPSFLLPLGTIGDAVAAKDRVSEQVLIPRPSPLLSTANCPSVSAVGDHFEYQGKTVAVLSALWIDRRPVGGAGTLSLQPDR